MNAELCYGIVCAIGALIILIGVFGALCGCILSSRISQAEEKRDEAKS